MMISPVLPAFFQALRQVAEWVMFYPALLLGMSWDTCSPFKTTGEFWGSKLAEALCAATVLFTLVWLTHHCFSFSSTHLLHFMGQKSGLCGAVASLSPPYSPVGPSSCSMKILLSNIVWLSRGATRHFYLPHKIPPNTFLPGKRTQCNVAQEQTLLHEPSGRTVCSSVSCQTALKRKDDHSGSLGLGFVRLGWFSVLVFLWGCGIPFINQWVGEKANYWKLIDSGK